MFLLRLRLPVIVVILLLLSIPVLACNKPTPFIDILTPPDNYIATADSMTVKAAFGPQRCSQKHEHAIKIDYIILKIDGRTAVTYSVPNHVKNGTKEFTINISSLAEGAHTLQASAHKGKKNSKLVAKSAKIHFTIVRGSQPPPVTPQSGFIRGTVVDSATETPLANVSVTAVNVTGTVPTNTDGTFSYPAPDSGQYVLKFTKDGYITSERTISVVSTRNVTAGTVYLKQLDSAVTTITNAGGTHSNAAGTLQFTFPPNSLPAGINSLEVNATLYEKDRELLAPLPKTTVFTYAFKVLPDRVTFTQPISGRLANSLGFAPGTSIPIGYYNPDTHKWEDTGTKGIVSDDGAWVNFQLTHFCGFDVNLPAWFLWLLQWRKQNSPTVTNQPPSSNNNNLVCAKNPINSLVRLKTGELSIDHTLPSFRTQNQDYALTFFYNSYSANPMTLIAADTNLNVLSTIMPETTSFKLDIEGTSVTANFYGAAEDVRYAYLYSCLDPDNNKLSTGSYPYTMKITNNYINVTYGTANYFGGPATNDTGIVIPPPPIVEPLGLTTEVKGRIAVNNQRNSPFGSGWELNGLQRLYFNPDGPLLLTEGDGSAKTFKKPQGKFLAIANTSADHGVSILRNNGDGTFRDPGNSTPYTSTGSFVSSADFNNDGINDLGVVNSGLPDISILLGQGNGDFEKPVFYPAGDLVNGNPVAVVTADFNGDSSIDVAVANPYNVVSILLNKGDGTFQNKVTYPASNYPCSLATADFNGDGITDLAVGDGSGRSTLYILLGNGDGSFQSPFPQSTPCDPTIIKSADFNGDNKADLIIAQSLIGILLGNGDGTFSEGAFWIRNNNPTAIAIADFNRDGFADFVMTSNETAGGNDGFYIYLGNGDGTFQSPTWSLVGSFPSSIVVADFNDDSFNDAAVLYTDYVSSYVGLFLGWGDGSFRTMTTSPAGSHFAGNLCAFDVTSEVYLLPPDGEYSTLKRNPDNTYTRTIKDGTVMNFNQQGLHTNTVDRNGNTISYTYIDANNDGKAEELSAITMPTGAKYQFGYIGGKLSSITDPVNKVTGFTMDSQSNLARITNADGTSRNFTYDANHLMLSHTDERGNLAEYFYDTYGAISEVHSPAREVTEVAQDGTETSSRQTEIRKYKISNVQGLINDLPAGTANVIRPQDIIEQTIDGKGNAWTYRTDNFGGRLMYSDPLSHATYYQRDLNSNLFRLTRPNGSVTEIYYDGQGNPTYIIEDQQHQGFRTYISYDEKFSQPVSITDPKGNITTLEYDTHGNPIKVADAQGNISTIEYNTRGQVTKVISGYGTPLQNETTFRYDVTTFNLKTVTDPLNHSTTFDYDTAGNIVKITDANSKITTFGYDTMNRVKTITEASGKVTTYTYDNMGNLTSITDASNRTTAFEYDDYRLLVKATNPLGEQKQYGYDINGNLTMVVTPNGAQIKYYNNPANVVEKKFTPEGIVTYEYNQEYNLTRAADVDSDLTFKYDLLGRLTQAEIMSGSIQPATTIDYSYDLNSNLTAMTTSNGIIRSYVYDTLNRLTDIPDIAHYEYDALGRRTGKSISSNNLNTNYTYDLASQLLSITNTPIAINNLYTYDSVGNKLSLTDNNGAHNYTYDDVYRLTNSTNPAETYSYDPVGNRNPLTQSYDAGNRLLDDGTYTYDYDHNGNMISKRNKITSETTTCTYSSDDQLISVSSGTMTASYKYDALGRRIEKNVAGTIIRYVYDGEDIIAEYDGNNQLIASYTHGPGIDELICLEKNNEKYYYISDSLNSITAIVDQNGNVAQTYRYDSFGNIINSSGTLTQSFTYTGREYDPETGLYFYRHRYYDPYTGRFLQEDPIGFVGGLNYYAYVRNNPLNLIDPFGLKEYGMLLEGFGFGVGPAAFEGGIYSLVDLSTGETYSWTYFSFGVGLGFGAAFQTEAGLFDFNGDPATIPNWSWSVSGFAAAGLRGASVQVSSPTGNNPLSLSPSHNMGLSMGHAIGAGTGISGMRSRSWYQGKGHILPNKLRQLIRQLKKRTC